MSTKIDKSDFMPASEVRELLGVTDRTLSRYRLKHWVEGVHFVAPVQRILYVRPMILNWMVNRKTDPTAHQAAMETWVAKTQGSPAKKGG
jgi:Putative excisionase (DUF1233)